MSHSLKSLISKNQAAYYSALSASDKTGKSTQFTEYMLAVIDKSLLELLGNSTKKLTDEERIQLFLEKLEGEFTRKDYLQYFKDVSSATASRDLKKAVEMGIIEKSGDKKTTTYRKIDIN